MHRIQSFIHTINNNNMPSLFDIKYCQRFFSNTIQLWLVLIIQWIANKTNVYWVRKLTTVQNKFRLPSISIILFDFNLSQQFHSFQVTFMWATLFYQGSVHKPWSFALLQFCGRENHRNPTNSGASSPRLTNPSPMPSALWERVEERPIIRMSCMKNKGIQDKTVDLSVQQPV